eukprot:5131459-Pyramimonas_sp.AAC.1
MQRATMTRGMNIARNSSTHQVMWTGRRRQDDLRRYCRREQPAGIMVNETPPWTTLAQRQGTREASMDQCTTGL